MKRETSTENFWTNEKLSLVTMGKPCRRDGGQASQQKKANLEKNLEELLNGLLDNDKKTDLQFVKRSRHEVITPEEKGFLSLH
jgi:hypothetical protein